MKTRTKTKKYAVSAHSVLWYVTKDTGRIQLKLDGVQKIATLKPTSTAEFFALVMMLQGPKRVLYDADKKVISTSW